MTPRIIDEASLHSREQEIIDAAIEVISELGVENLTMDKVVAKVSFSKGTVYKHFLGKEDLMLAIGNQAAAILIEMFGRASSFEGFARSRMLLLNFSYLIYAMLHPVLFKCAMCSKSPNVYGKSSEQRLSEQEQLEFKLLSTIHNIFTDAVTEKNLTLPEHMNIQQLCFSNWSGSYGVISLLSEQVEQCSGRYDLVVENELINQNNIFYDGLNWLPLTTQKDYRAELKHALSEIFPKELAQLKLNGRELNY